MKQENLKILQRIQPAIEKIIVNECESIYEEYKINKELLFKKDLKIKQLIKEREQLEKFKKYQENYAGRLRKVVDILASDWVIEIIQESYSGFDDYWNWWGCQVEFAKYKDMQIELQYDSF